MRIFLENSFLPSHLLVQVDPEGVKVLVDLASHSLRLVRVDDGHWSLETICTIPHLHGYRPGLATVTATSSAISIGFDDMLDRGIGST